MGWEKRAQEDQIGSLWDDLGGGGGGDTFTSLTDALSGSGFDDWFGGGGGGTTYPCIDYGGGGGGMGGTYPCTDYSGGFMEPGQLDYVPMGAGSADAARRAEGLSEDEIVYTLT